ncbi:MAG: NAD-dependent epimerase/dehydratase family protein [Opitutales bacterium]
MRCLVTGGTGFLGGEVARQLLDAGYSVRLFQRSACPALEQLGCEVHRGDLDDAPAVRKAAQGCETIIHTAAKAGIWGLWETYYRINVTGTRNVVSAAVAANARFLVHTSTPSVVFNHRSLQDGDERLPYGWNIPCAYAATKVLAEQIALEASGRNGLTTCALRPHLIWGPGDPHLVPRLLSRARAGRLRIIGGGRNRVDLTHVENAARAHLDALHALAEGRAGGQAFFITDGAPVQLWPWINALLERKGLQPVTQRIPYPLAKQAGRFAEKIWQGLRLPGEPPMTVFLAHELATDHYFSPAKSRRLLGYHPKTFDLSSLLGDN